MDSSRYEKIRMTNLPTLVNGYILASADRQQSYLKKERARLCEGMDHQSKLFTSVSSPALRIGTINVSCFSLTDPSSVISVSWAVVNSVSLRPP